MTEQPQKIVIDMAGALEKITPEMMDEVRDMMIHTLTQSGKIMLDALEQIIELAQQENADEVLFHIQQIATAALPNNQPPKLPQKAPADD